MIINISQIIKYIKIILKFGIKYYIYDEKFFFGTLKRIFLSVGSYKTFDYAFTAELK